MGLVFSKSNFFTNKISQGRELSAIYLQEFSFNCSNWSYLRNLLEQVKKTSVTKNQNNFVNKLPFQFFWKNQPTT